ncbi:hypothetical protein J7W08_01860 [Methanococcoides orientis]|uniref:thiamine pyrophosphate-dependent enzyme n=1 Tax=Methanococcoides orientis TaxID=2822137 RepID=UPI001E5016B6|nr:thiamine pyrophosphate-dependent enzyme [Methanococcoides orientis]UGV41081.1 hypothetical protein J7W08_01860 [Methanococcoides orientis]
MSNSLASMGFGLSAEISVCLIHHEKKVVTIAGDAGILMNLQDLETAVRLNCNLVIIIYNDSFYGLIEWESNQKFGESFDSSFKNPDFMGLTNSFGARGIRISIADELGETLLSAFKEGGVWLIDFIPPHDRYYLSQALQLNFDLLLTSDIILERDSMNYNSPKLPVMTPLPERIGKNK